KWAGSTRAPVSAAQPSRARRVVRDWAGLADTDAATVIDNRGEQAMFSDGPFLESKEYLAGIWVWEAPDLDVALKLAAEASKACDRKIEVRPFQ
ncbi:YciI family protein, partial [Streptomyces sp. NPDC005070]